MSESTLTKRVDRPEAQSVHRAARLPAPSMANRPRLRPNFPTWCKEDSPTVSALRARYQGCFRLPPSILRTLERPCASSWISTRTGSRLQKHSEGRAEDRLGRPGHLSNHACRTTVLGPGVKETQRSVLHGPRLRPSENWRQDFLAAGKDVWSRPEVKGRITITYSNFHRFAGELKVLPGDDPASRRTLGRDPLFHKAIPAFRWPSSLRKPAIGIGVKAQCMGCIIDSMSTSFPAFPTAGGINQEP